MLLERAMEDAAVAVEERKRLLGRRIRVARKGKGWKQRELAAQVHVDTISVSRWERGQHSPDMDMLALIAQVTNRPLWFFLLDSEPKDQEETATRLKGAETRIATLEFQLSWLADAQGTPLPPADDQAGEQ